MNPKELTFSRHFSVDRQARLDEINYTLDNDWGVTMIRVWDHVHNNWKHLSTTGLVFCMDKDETFIVTMYIPTKSQLIAIYKEARHFITIEERERGRANYLKSITFRNFYEKFQKSA